MEKRKWLWKRKSSEKSSCETESSGSISSHSERFSDDQQEALKGSPDHNTQSPEVSSKSVASTEHTDESSLKSEDVNNSVKRLTEKLSAALVNVSAKEDLVKQHAKVAEEAVAGWEKAENEVATLKQQLEVAFMQKSVLEDRVSHLDGALKECVRQLRQAKEEKEQKIQEAISKITQEWESTKCKLENQLLELQNKAEKAESSARIDPDLCFKIEYLEKENSALRLEIESQMEELEVRTIERDLSTQAAETASKQNLESIKKVAKLEAECRRLKAMACKSSMGNDNKSNAASSIYVESFTDSHSDNGECLNVVDVNLVKVNSLELNECEQNISDSWASALVAELDQFKNEKGFNKCVPNSSVDINLMDDFLEMERLAASQHAESRHTCLESKIVATKSKHRESALRTELEAMVHQTSELEEKLEKLEKERDELGANESNGGESSLRTELEAEIHRTADLEGKLEKLETEKAELEDRETFLKTELEARIRQTTELEDNLEKLETEKAELEYIESILRTELEARIQRTDHLEEKLKELETEKDALRNGESVLRTELEAMIHQTAELEEKLRKLETELAESIKGESVLRTQLDAMVHRTAELEDKLMMLETKKAESRNGESVLRTEIDAMIHRTAELEEKLDKLETEKVESRNSESVLRTELNATIHQTAELEKKLEKLETEKVESRAGESALRTELEAMILQMSELEKKLEKLETDKSELEAALTKSQECTRASQLQLMEAEMKVEVLKRELEIAKESKQRVESQLVSLEAEALTMSTKVNHLEEEIKRERALSTDIAIKCQELQEELSREKEEIRPRQNVGFNGELKIKQEDVAMAAGKLAECQQTIASLGNQLKALATLEDFLIDASNVPEFSAAASLIPRTGEQWKLHSSRTFSPKRDSNSLKIGDESSVTSLKQNQENRTPPSSSSSSTSAMVLSTHVSSEKNRNGFAKFFSRTKSGIRLEI